MKENVESNNGIVSVIIPVYQAEKYVERCVKSVINQTYKNLEIILIDDGSIDNSLSVCENLAKRDLRIRVFHQENRGVAATRNKGLEYAIGEYVYFLDSDDWIDENTIFEMKTAMENSDADLCICGFCYIKDGSSPQYHVPANDVAGLKSFMEKDFWKLYEDAVLFNIGTKLYKRCIIESTGIRFSTDMILYEDIRFCLEYLDQSKIIQLLETPYYYYFKGNIGSVTHGYQPEFWKSTLTYCNLLMNRSNENNISLKKAVLQCLYRAFLQECHNPCLEKKTFLEILDEKCFPFVEKLNLKGSRLHGETFDQKVFRYLISHHARQILWLLALLVSVR